MGSNKNCDLYIGELYAKGVYYRVLVVALL